MRAAPSADRIDVDRRIEAAHARLRELEKLQAAVERKLEALENERPRYELLREIRDRMEQLDRLGGGPLLWGDGLSREDAQAHLMRVAERIAGRDKEVGALREKQQRIKDEMQRTVAYLGVLGEEVLELQEQEEERSHEFVIERQAAVRPYRAVVMPWAGDRADERRFRRILLLTLVFAMLLGVLIPLWELPLLKRAAVVEVPERLAKLIVEKKPPPPAPMVERRAQEQEPKKEAKQEPKKEQRPRESVPRPQTEEAKVARKKAESTGLLAFKENFAELMDNPAEDRLGAQARVSNKGQQAGEAKRSLVVANVDGASGGINTASLSRNVGGAGRGIGGVSFSRVASTIGSEYAGEDRPLSDGAGASRTDEEIQIVFDRYKAALYRIYNRELRKNPVLQGKLVLRITIEPDGKVSLCKLESSDMEAPALEEQIVARVGEFNFGPKEGVPAVTILYPIEFVPASN